MEKLDREQLLCKHFANTPIKGKTPVVIISFTHKMRPKHGPFFAEEPSKASSVDALHSTPKYKSQSIYSIQVDTRLTTLGRMATINLVLVLSLHVDIKRDREEERGRFREFDA